MGWHKKFVADVSGGHWYWADETGRCWHRCSRWNPLEDIAAAWEVHHRICKDGGRPFTTRKNYLEALGPIINERLHREGKLNEGLAVDWPWLLVVLKPEDICLAALKVKGVDYEDQDS